MSMDMLAPSYAAPLLGEPRRAYQAFLAYRDLPPAERSIVAAYRALTGGEQAESRRRPHWKAPRQWGQWAADWSWVSRAAAYDAHLDEQRRAEADRVAAEKAEELARRREEHREAEIELSRKLLERAQLLLRWPTTEQVLQRDGKTYIIKPARWRERDVAAIILAASKVGRLALDMETDHSKAEVTTTSPSAAERIIQDASEGELRAWLARLQREEDGEV